MNDSCEGPSVFFIYMMGLCTTNYLVPNFRLQRYSCNGYEFEIRLLVRQHAMSPYVQP